MRNKTLGQVLFEKMEEPQGYGFISDDVAHRTDEEVLEIARNALDWTNVGARRLREFIRIYGGGK